ncbi:MAG: response regulator transcription factor [Pyrinomonadaceae bacterium]
MPKVIRTLLIESQTLTRIGIKTILGEQNDIDIVGEAETGAGGFEEFRRLKPDVTVLGLRLPDSCAVDDIEKYLAEDPQARIVVLAEQAGDAEISRSLKGGAYGYICKDATADQLIEAIRTVAGGRKYIPSGIAGILSENLGQEDLTPTERKVLAMIVEGKANKEIAYALEVSENTVKTHVKNIFSKLGVSDRTSAATTAIKRGFALIR